MTHATTERTTDEERKSRENGEEDGLWATAEQFQITDMQHWIDLCA